MNSETCLCRDCDGSRADEEHSITNFTFTIDYVTFGWKEAIGFLVSWKREKKKDIRVDLEGLTFWKVSILHVL